MSRLIQYRMEAEESFSEGIQIWQFLTKKGYSRKLLTALRKEIGPVMLNGTPVRLITPLSEKDSLTVFMKEEPEKERPVPSDLPYETVYEDEDILVINKPAGLPIHPSQNHYTDSLSNAVYFKYLKSGKDPDEFVFRCVNRLDKDTSGLTIAAKNRLSSGILSEQVVRREIHREYLAVIEGSMVPENGSIEAPIGRKPDSIIERMVDFTHGEYAKTHYETLQKEKDRSLIRLRLETGRTHQIRVHMAYLSHPLFGDSLYGGNTDYIKRQALHSHCLSFKHPITGKYLTFTAEMPPDMKNLISLPYGTRTDKE